MLESHLQPVFCHYLTVEFWENQIKQAKTLKNFVGNLLGPFGSEWVIPNRFGKVIMHVKNLFLVTIWPADHINEIHLVNRIF